MIRLRGGSSIAVFLAAAALALGACGGDDKGSGDTTGVSLDTTVNSGTGTTGTTTEGQTTGTTREDRTTTQERGDDKGGRKRSGSGRGGGSEGGSGSSGSGTQPGNVRKVARTVCNSFLPKTIARDLEKGDKKPEDVARDYSRGFPKKQQERAYEGCLQGLKARG